jgi:hypothetical protein
MALSLLVVHPDPARLADQLVCFQHAGCVAAGTTSFPDARALVAAFRPDVLVTSVRIGEFNGIHLAILARMTHGAPTIVVGDDDPVLEREAEQAGAQYVITPADPADLVALVRRAAGSDAPPRRWTRVKPHGPVAAMAGGHSARIVDISYGGIGLRVPRTADGPLPRDVEVTLPELGITLTAQRVWHRTEVDHVRYGLQLPVVPSDGPVTWRAVVEAVRGAMANN